MEELQASGDLALQQADLDVSMDDGGASSVGMFLIKIAYSASTWPRAYFMIRCSFATQLSTPHKEMQYAQEVEERRLHPARAPALIGRVDPTATPN
jgi:hypothetical protein